MGKTRKGHVWGLGQIDGDRKSILVISFEMPSKWICWSAFGIQRNGSDWRCKFRSHWYVDGTYSRKTEFNQRKHVDKTEKQLRSTPESSSQEIRKNQQRRQKRREDR